MKKVLDEFMGTRYRKIVFLMLKEGQLYKSVKFSDFIYVGDPINTVKLFNSFKVDELIIVDTDCTNKEIQIKTNLLETIAKTARMPICYGGGINSLSQIHSLMRMGFEKVLLSNAALGDPSLVQKAANTFGSQTLVGCLDIRFCKIKDLYEIYTHNGTKRQPFEFWKAVENLQKIGMGEILISSIDRDGTFEGYDRQIISTFKHPLDVPLTILGGAKSASDVKNTVKNMNVNAAAGSAFTFMNKNQQVLLNY